MLILLTGYQWASFNFCSKDLLVHQDNILSTSNHLSVCRTIHPFCRKNCNRFEDSSGVKMDYIRYSVFWLHCTHDQSGDYLEKRNEQVSAPTILQSATLKRLRNFKWIQLLQVLKACLLVQKVKTFLVGFQYLSLWYSRLVLIAPGL